MASPFPGMDPYLEGHLWPDVHHSLALITRELIAPQVSPKYVVYTEVYIVNDTAPAEDIGIMYPDVEVLHRKAEEPAAPYQSAHSPFTPTTMSLPTARPIEVRIPVVEIRDRRSNQLITAIEILSPVNKRQPGLPAYLAKRARLQEAGVHLLEIDLLRRGQRPFAHPSLPPSHYLVVLQRAGAERSDVWAFNLPDPLPVVPVPLIAPDADAVLDLGKALALAYERGYYHLSIDYREAPPPPALSEEEREWARTRVEARQAER
jgi:hypothetical protein